MANSLRFAIGYYKSGGSYLLNSQAPIIKSQVPGIFLGIWGLEFETQ